MAVAAELVGVCQRALEMTLEYVKERKQFDTPVGAYQAVSHRCAADAPRHGGRALGDVLRGVGGGRGARSGCARGRRWPRLAASGAGREVTASAIQAHGGIGFTWEADVHWLYKRAQLDSVLLGGAGEHRARLARIAAERLRAPATA